MRNIIKKKNKSIVITGRKRIKVKTLKCSVVQNGRDEGGKSQE